MIPQNKINRLPKWMKVPMPHGENYSRVRNTIEKHSLNTICSSGNCPNKGECWSAGTATFMILGDTCTRNCQFCFVKTAIPSSVDWDEPLRVANAIKTLELKHCVITSVARDDLEDGGIEVWAATIKTIKNLNPSITIEALIPDFNRDLVTIQPILDARPEVISHNIETVKRLTPNIRSMATYNQSLNLLSYISSKGFVTKSGFMLGLGETKEEIIITMNDLYKSGVRVLTIGQYLPPSALHAKLVDYITPEAFEEYKKIGLEKGFRFVESGPLVRSSYHAERHVNV